MTSPIDHEPVLLEKKTDNTAAYAEEATIVSSFVALVRSDTSKENKIIQTDIVMRYALLVD